ncbi:MAG: hypothetical protein KTR20_04090 [Cellvibrionaceae bacterium]|nr:hypothetical protein [Cellvibrionaceae bacterium]
MMKLALFTPDIKVHKQRHILRATDARIARYTRRGILLSFSLFCLCMLLGDYFALQTNWAIFLGLGVLISTAVRAYLLFRFDASYGNAPGRWRNRFFMVSVISAGWWGLMLAAVTDELGLSAEAPLLWLYTVGFFSCSSYVFAPYHRFYSLYMLVCMLPSALLSLLSAHLLHNVFGVILLLVTYLLHRQGQALGRDYWARLQGTYDLTQRTNALKAEQITSQSSLSNTEALFSNVSRELKTLLQETMGSLALLKSARLSEEETQLLALAEQKNQQQLRIVQNVLEFSDISSRTIALDEGIIDLRSSLEKAIVAISPQIYQKNIELYSQFSPDFPLRVKGDHKRIQQIISNLISSAVHFSRPGNMLVDIHHRHLSDATGKLSVNLFIDKPLRSLEIEQQLIDIFKPHCASDMTVGLHLAIAKGLVACMNGSMGTNYTDTEQLRFWFTLELPTVNTSSIGSQTILKVNGKRVLLYQPPNIIEHEYKNTLESWGLQVDIAQDLNEANTLLAALAKSSSAFDAVMIYTRLDDISAIELVKKVNSGSDTPVPHIIALTQEQHKLPAIAALLQRNPLISIVHKPVEYKALRRCFKDALVHDYMRCYQQQPSFLAGKKILLFQKQDFDNTLAKLMLHKLGCEVSVVNSAEHALNALAAQAFDAFITESQLDDIDMCRFIDSAKMANQQCHENAYILPVLGLNNHHQAGDNDETQCLQLGMDYYINTPLEIDDLQAILRRWIGRAIHMAETATAQSLKQVQTGQ